MNKVTGDLYHISTKQIRQAEMGVRMCIFASVSVDKSESARTCLRV